MALTKNTPKEIKASLTIKAQGVENTIMLTYHNHDPEAYEAFVSNPENLKIPESATDPLAGMNHANAQIVLFVVKSFDDGTDKDFPLNLDGLLQMERYWPGSLVGIARGYHRTRVAEVEKN